MELLAAFLATQFALLLVLFAGYQLQELVISSKSKQLKVGEEDKESNKEGPQAAVQRKGQGGLLRPVEWMWRWRRKEETAGEEVLRTGEIERNI